jgi:hypothetical protein
MTRVSPVRDGLWSKIGHRDESQGSISFQAGSLNHTRWATRFFVSPEGPCYVQNSPQGCKVAIDAADADRLERVRQFNTMPLSEPNSYQ